MQGIVFDIKQMAVFDGPGIRTTVFLKGCPLSCVWCHNPEGLSPRPQLMVNYASCIKCGRCVSVCPTNCVPADCTACGACVSVCPLRLRRVAGTPYEAAELAEHLLRDRTFLEATGGGITFSGGEPLMQSEFLLEVISHLQGIHCAMETCGYSSPIVFKEVVDQLDFILMDIKLIDRRKHLTYCGKDNKPILENLRILKASGKPFVIRIPLIPMVNDSKNNLEATACLLEGAENLQKVELLRYHKTAGAKYEMLSKIYEPDFDVQRIPFADCSYFTERGIPCEIL